MHLTASSTSTYLTCPRKYEWAYVQRIRRVASSEALRVGSGFHKAKELLAEGVAWQQVCHDTLRDCVSEYEAHMVLAMASAHAQRWADEQLKVVGVEDKWTRDLGGVPCRGMIDERVEMPDGRLGVHEYKTTSLDIEPGGAYWRRLKMNLQVAMYQLAADADTVVYDVVRRPTIKPKQIPLLDPDGLKIVTQDGERVYKKNGDPRQSAGADMILATRPETPGEYGERCYEQLQADPDKHFARIECPRVEGDTAAAISDLQAVERLISLAVYPRNTGACNQYGTCEYFELCSSNVTPSADAPAGFMQLKSAHPELDGDEPTTTTH